MKASVIFLIGLCLGIGGTTLYFTRQKTAPAPVPMVETSVAPTPARPEVVAIPPAAPPVTAIVSAPAPAPVPTTNSGARDPKAEAAAAFRQRIDTLLSPQLTAAQKREMFDQFRKGGQIDDVIAELKRRGTENPAAPGIMTTLGEAQLNKVRLLHESGADVNEVGIVAMQADQSFNAALKIDPKDWEAQFVKYSSMFYWPADAARDTDVAQKLAGLIDQQDTLPQQPEFVQTYAVLGDQYKKMGKLDFAEATWRMGLTKFPSDPTLLKRLAEAR